MKGDVAVKWHARGAMLYAFGAWTLLGSYAYYRFFMSDGEKDKPQNTEDKEELVDTSLPEQKEEKRTGFHVHSEIRYKENFVPYSTRLFSYLKALSGGTENERPEK